MKRSQNSTFWNLVQAIRCGQVIAFVGAGVSRSVRGTPTWDKTIAELISAIQKDIETNPGRSKDYFIALEKAAENDPLFAAEQCHKYLQEQFPVNVKSILNVD